MKVTSVAESTLGAKRPILYFPDALPTADRQRERRRDNEVAMTALAVGRRPREAVLPELNFPRKSCVR
jgi:hypothetical protein